MKKLLIVPVILASAGSIQAWNTSPQKNLLLSGESSGQDLPMAAPGPDESTFVAWLSWEDESAALKMQLVDKDGEPQLGENGIYVSQYPTPTWSSGYDIDSDAEGNAYIVYSDKRNGVWQAYVYKMGPDGEKKWGEGVPVAELSAESCLNPKLLHTDAGNIIVAYQSLVGLRNTIKITKLTGDGAKAWGGVIELPGTNGLYTLAGAGDDSFYVAYVQADAGNMAVMRYTANGEAAWDAPAIVDQGRAVVSSEPEAVPYADGGVVLCWRHAENITKVVGAVQAVSREGNLLWSEPQFYSAPHVAAISPDGNIYVAYSFTDAYGTNMSVSRYNSDGEYAWDSPLLLDGSSYQVSIYGVQVVADGSELAVVYRNASDFNRATIEYSHLDSNGEVLDTQVPVSTMQGDKGRGALTYAGGRQMVLTWGDNGMSNGKGSVYAQNIVLPEPASLTTAVAGSESLQAVYCGGELMVNRRGNAAVLDCYGRLLYCGIVPDGTISLPGLAAGVYVINIDGQSAKFTVL